AGWKRMREILPAVLVCGVSFAVVQFLVSNFIGPELTDIIAALVSMGCLALLLRFWRPAQVYRFATEGAVATAPRRIAGASSRSVEPDLPGVAAAKGRGTDDGVDSPQRIWWAYGMYIVLVLGFLIG